MDEKNGVLELGELKYHKKWYLPNYFRNSVSDPIISKINANGPFCPRFELGDSSNGPRFSRTQAHAYETDRSHDNRRQRTTGQAPEINLPNLDPQHANPWVTVAQSSP